MTTSEPRPCPACHLLIDEGDAFCRHCGRSLKPGQSFFYSHAGLLVLALVLGPFALPFVWMSKRISVTAKIIYSVVLCVLGVYFCIACYRIYQLTMQSAQSLLGGGF